MGCGTGDLARHLSRCASHVTGLDADPRQLQDRTAPRPRAADPFDTTSDLWTQHEIPEFTGNWLHAAGDRLILIAVGFEDVYDHE